MRTLKLLVLVPFAIAAVAAACGGKKEPVTPSTDTIVGEGGADMPDASSDIAAVDAGSAAVAAVDSGAAAAIDTAVDAGTDGGKKKKKAAK